MKVRKVIEPYWYISETGRIFSKKSGKFKELKTRINRWNRRTITIRGKTYKLSRLTAIKWVPNESNYPMVLHKDNNTLNDHKDNLYWGTQSMNMMQYYNGLTKINGLPKNNIFRHVHISAFLIV